MGQKSSTETFFAVLSEYTGHAVDTAEEFERLKAILHTRVAELFGTDLEWRPGAQQLLDGLAEPTRLEGPDEGLLRAAYAAIR